MNDSKLPIIKNNQLIQPSQSTHLEVVKGLNTIKYLFAAGIITIIGAIGVFTLTQYTLLSVFLAIATLVFFGARQLVRKSLALTTSKEQIQIRSVQSQLEEIKKQVSKCKFLDSVETEGVKAALQSEQLAYQYITLKNILSQKFEPTEITFSRYLVSIEDSCLSIGENLIHSKNILENLNLTATTKNEIWHTQKNQVNGLLVATEEALIQLASLYISINEITTKENNRNQLEQSMLNIKELAERAKNYSNF